MKVCKVNIIERKKYYISWIHTYEKRRESLKKELGVNPFSRKGDIPMSYLKASRRISYMVNKWKKGLKGIDRKLRRLKLLEKSVVEFTGTSIRYEKFYPTKEQRVARALFYRYGLQNGLRGVDLSDFIGVSNRQCQPRKYRKMFIAKSNANPELKQLWANFKDYCEYSMKQKNNKKVA